MHVHLFLPAEEGPAFFTWSLGGILCECHLRDCEGGIQKSEQILPTELATYKKSYA
jgi:hypothetical protein